MWLNEKNPKISWIGTKKESGSEWTKYTKVFTVNGALRSAAIRFETDCTCAVFVNGTFIISGTGRLPERVNCHEITSKLHVGENTIEIVMGGPYFQTVSEQWYKQCGFYWSSAAIEICIEYMNGTREIIASDSSWIAETEEGKAPATEALRVTEAEYEMMWKNAAQWLEPALHRQKFDPAVIDVVGEEYQTYADTDTPEFYCYDKVISTNMTENDGAFSVNDITSEASDIILDFGRIVVGYVELDYESKADTVVKQYYDYTESVDDFNNIESGLIAKLSVKETLHAGEGSWLNLRRRAFRYLKITLPAEAKNVVLKNIRVRPCIMPVTKTGYFTCSDDMLNTAWETGRYTLHVNKQQEYESCPRNEMEFYSGDGAIDAWIDLYAFGNSDMMNTSLSVKHDESAGGVVFTNKFNKNIHQWDYFAWRIICVYNHYMITGDKEFLARYFDEERIVLEWLLEKVGFDNLIFQKRCFIASFTFDLCQVDWTCSSHRLGEKSYLNALLYRSLVCMSEMAADYGERALAAEWSEKAEKVKSAVNENLWSDEKKSYMDPFMGDYIAQDNNIVSIMFGLADEQRIKSVLNTVKENLWTPYGTALLNVPHKEVRGGIATISPAMSMYEAECHFLYGNPEDGMELMRRVWGTMLKKGARTFWEYSPNDPDAKWNIPSHAWSGGCVYLLGAYVMGIRFDHRGVYFKPNVCDLTHMKCAVPTVHGIIAASFEKVTDNGKTVNKFRIAVPKETNLSYELPENSTIEILTYNNIDNSSQN